jgi:AraC family transcriptional regulator of arabinose operon
MPKRTSKTAATPPAHDPWDALTLSIVHANRYPCLPQWNIPLHTLTYTGLALCTHGRGWLEVNGQRFELKPGALTILLPGQNFAAGHDPAKPVTLLSIGAHMAAPGTTNPLAPLDPPARITFTPREARALAPLFNDVIHAFQHRSIYNALAARGAFMRLIAHTLALVPSLPAGRVNRIARVAPLADERVRVVCALIESRMGEPLTLADLAASAHLTPPHFSLLFRNATGLSPMDYLRRRRIDRAKSLLAQPRSKVETVSHDVGFADPYHFSRVFRRIVGVPPRVYAQSKRRPFFP